MACSCGRAAARRVDTGWLAGDEGRAGRGPKGQLAEPPSPPPPRALPAPAAAHSCCALGALGRARRRRRRRGHCMNKRKPLQCVGRDQRGRCLRRLWPAAQVACCWRHMWATPLHRRTT